jgi:hypothetical protein
MQSVRRAIKRGNAVIAHDPVTRGMMVYTRKRKDKTVWVWAIRNRSSETEFSHAGMVTLPLTKKYIDGCGADRFIYRN